MCVNAPCSLEIPIVNYYAALWPAWHSDEGRLISTRVKPLTCAHIKKTMRREELLNLGCEPPTENTTIRLNRNLGLALPLWIGVYKWYETTCVKQNEVVHPFGQRVESATCKRNDGGYKPLMDDMGHTLPKNVIQHYVLCMPVNRFCGSNPHGCTLFP